MWTENSVTLTGPPHGASKGKRLHGIDVNMKKMSNVAMTLTAVALFVDGQTTIRDGEFHELLSKFQPHNSWLTVLSVLFLNKILNINTNNVHIGNFIL